jgi:hypothetical protein
MHSEVREPRPSKCPRCGMELMPEGTRFALLRHMFSSPLHIMIMVAVMLVIMVGAMILLHR